MGKLIVSGAVIIILALIVVGYAMYHRRNTVQVKGDLNQKEEREMRKLLDRAARIMLTTGPANTIEDSDVLSTRTADAMDSWLRDHNEFMRKEINA